MVEIASVIGSFYFRVAARKTVSADPSQRYTLRVAGTLSNQGTIIPHNMESLKTCTHLRAYSADMTLFKIKRENMQQIKFDIRALS